ncbi:MAG: hypothetical protein ACRCSS_18090 [Shewanella sp.]
MNPVANGGEIPQANLSSASNSSDSELSQKVKRVKTVTFSLETKVYEYPESDNSHRKSDFFLSFIEEAYYREVDKEARKHGLSWAENHTDWNSHYPFSLERALGTELSSEETNLTAQHIVSDGQ